MEIPNENNFRAGLSNGINLFLGAGFSVLAQSQSSAKLPVGSALRDELVKHFKLPAPLKDLDLDATCSMIETTEPAQLRAYLNRRFSVGTYDPRYAVLDRLNIRHIFTTNVDNLLYKVFAGTCNHYLNDVTIHGPRQRDRAAIDYVPLHGSIVSEDAPLVFGTMRVVTSFRADSDRWSAFTNSLQQFPTLFWGCGLADKDLIEALSPSTIGNRAHQEKWALLHNPDDATVQYFTSVFGFNIIRGDTTSMLDYLSSIDLVETSSPVTQPTRQLFPLYAIPDAGTVPVRSLRSFYEGFAPTWHQIFTGRIKPTSHYSQVINLLNGNKDVLVLGIPASGKTTLMMQIANDFQFSGHKLVCDSLIPEQAHFIVARLEGKRALVFVDNFADSIEAFNVLLTAPNVLVTGFDRDTAYETAAHRIVPNSVAIYDITELTKTDMQMIYSEIPADIRNDRFMAPSTESGVSPSLFEVIEANTRQHLPELRTRFRKLLRTLESNESLHDLLIMIAYVHQCRVPVSYDMAAAFLRDKVADYQEIFEMIDSLGRLVTEQLVDAEQDYYAPRSSIVAEAILAATDSQTFRRVFLRFHHEVSPVRIYNYDTFKRKGFDQEYARKAFPNLDYLPEGLSFYQKAFDRDRSPYLLQQAALYLAHLKQHREAFDWIDRAVQLSKGKIPTIRNSYAVILFNTNADLAALRPSDTDIKSTLDQSMDILKDCYRFDKRKYYHTQTFARQAVQYWDTYRDDQARAYLATAEEWLLSEAQRVPYKTGEIHRLLEGVRSRLRRATKN